MLRCFKKRQREFNQNNWKLNQLPLFMTWAGIEDEVTRKYILLGVPLKITMLKACEGDK